jgi:excisionase family DNA binding protein
MVMGDEMGNIKPFLSVREVADYLDIDYKTVYRLVRKGEIPAVKVGGVYRVRRTELESYLERQSVTGRMPEAQDTGERRFLLEGGDREITLSPGTARPAAMETAFFARLESNIGAAKQLKHPSTGRKFRPRNPLATRSEQTAFDDMELMKLLVAEPAEMRRLRATPAYVRAELPRNARRTYTLLPPSGRTEGVRVIGQFWTRLDVILQSGDYTEPLDLGSTRKIIESTARRVEKEPYQNVLGIASPTGFTEECRGLVQGSEGRWKIIIPKLLIVLVDLVELLLYAFGSERQSTDLQGLFSLSTKAEERDKRRSAVEDILRSEESVAASALCAGLGVMPGEAEMLMQELAKEGGYELLRLRDGELVLYRKG